MTALLGFGSHGRDIIEVWRRSKFASDPLYVFDHDHEGIHPPELNDLRMHPWIVGINDPSERRAVRDKFSLYGAEVLIDPTSIGAGLGCKFGLGVVIAPQVTILADVELGDHTHINYGVGLTRCQVGSFVTVGPGAVICGDVTIGDECLIGAGSVICDRVTIGDRCKIGAGAVVLPKAQVPDDTTVIGVWK